MATPDLLTSGQAAEMLGVSTETIRRWADTGKLARIELPSGHLRFVRADVESLLIPTKKAAVGVEP